MARWLLFLGRMRYECPQLLGFLAVAIAASVSPCQAADVAVSHLYNLSDFSGTIPYNHASLHVDRAHGEIYVAYQNVVRIFNASGMEVFSFGNPDEGGLVLDVAVDDEGDIYTLSRNLRNAEIEAPFFIERRDYRGVPKTTIVVSARAPELSDFVPQRIFHRQGRFLLVDRSRMQAVETDLRGAVLGTHDLGAMLAIPDEDRPGTQISGFDLDPAGNMLMTVPVLFRAFVISPEGTVRSFGRGGSIPGSFGVAAGITVDDHGRYFVADKLRCVVMVFDSDFRFVTEFGYRGGKPENLIAPNDLAVGSSGELYVTQRRNRGVAVFSVTGNDRPGRDPARDGDRKEVSTEPEADSQQTPFSRTDLGSSSPVHDRLHGEELGPVARRTY